MTEFEKELFKLEANIEIQNLMGSYSFYLDGRKYDALMDLFAKDQVDVRVELGGVYQGRDGLERLYPGKHYDQHAGGSYPGYEGRGNVAKHPQNTPLVVVGDDLKTAKGIWISMGFASIYRDGIQEMHWGMFRYGADFIYENGAWKIWHLNVYSGFMADGDRSWSDPRPRPPMPPGGPGGPDGPGGPGGPDGPGGPGGPGSPPFKNPFEQFPSDFPPTSDYDYRVDTSVPYVPEVPEPYDVFDMRNAN